jgi:hypothetical protein
MNERICELADRAGEYADFEYGICTNEFLEKFAELIVRECVALAKKHYDDLLPWGGVEQIKEHLGVDQ